MTTEERAKRERQRAAAEAARNQRDMRADSAMSIREFCNRHSFSLSFFYLLEERGQAPRTMQVGGRRLISVEEAARWRAQRTTDALAIASGE
jgi:predicted DNA-binding transcriptional regulator AlpA